MATTTRATDNSSKDRRLLTGASMILPLLAVSPVWASDWNFQPNINVSESYTSNLNLDSDNEESSFITEVAPGFSLNRQGARIQANVAYNMRFINYSADEGDDDIRHRLNASLGSELYEDHLFLDANAGISQQFLSTQSASNGPSDSLDANTTETYTYRISPYWQQRIGDSATLTARATYSQIDYDSNATEGSKGIDYALNFDFAPSSSKFFYGLVYDQAKRNPQDNDTTTAYNANAFLGYNVSSQLSGRLTYGYVDNDLENTTTDNADSGDFWGLGVDWSPSPLTTINANYNSRLQSSSDYGVTLSRRLRDGAFVLSYSEGITDIQQLLLDQQSALLVLDPEDGQIKIVPSLQGNQILIGNANILVPTLVNDKFINKSLNADLSVTRSKSTYTLSAFQRERIYQSGSLGTEQDLGISLGWTVRLNSIMSSSLSYSWTEIDADNTSTDTLNSLSAGVSRSLSEDTNVSVSADYSMRESDVETREFDQYILSVNFSHNF